MYLLGGGGSKVLITSFFIARSNIIPEITIYKMKFIIMFMTFFGIETASDTENETLSIKVQYYKLLKI